MKENCVVPLRRSGTNCCSLRIGHMDGAGARTLREHLADEMRRSSDAAGGVMQLAGLSLEQSDQFGNRTAPAPTGLTTSTLYPVEILTIGARSRSSRSPSLRKKRRRRHVSACPSPSAYGRRPVASGHRRRRWSGSRPAGFRPTRASPRSPARSVAMMRLADIGRRSGRGRHDNTDVPRRIVLGLRERSGGHRDVRCRQADARAARRESVSMSDLPRIVVSARTCR